MAFSIIHRGIIKRGLTQIFFLVPSRFGTKDGDLVVVRMILFSSERRV